MTMRLIRQQWLFSAVRSGEVERVRQLIEEEEEEKEEEDEQAAASRGRGGWSDLMSVQNEAGETPLFIAADNNYMDVFDYLLHRFSSSSTDLKTSVFMIPSFSGFNPFHAAAKRGHLGIVKTLLSMWPELCKVCDSSNTSPLYSAAVQGHLEVVNVILDTDATSMRIVRKNGKTALHTAGRYGLLQIVKAFIQRDAGIVTIKDKKGQTALHMAAKGQDTAVIEELMLAEHSILNERDKKGNTAIHIATRKCRPQVVSLLLSYMSINVNIINNQHETAMDLADKLQYGESALVIKEALIEAGAKHARNVGKVDEARELKRAVSDIKHEVHSQLIQNEKTNKRVYGIAKELKKIHREAVQNTINSLTVVAVLFASIAFLAIFNIPGLYLETGPDAGKARIADTYAFRVFCLLNASSLFISLSVVVVQITLVAWDTRAQKQIVSVINKLMWAACISTCGAFLSIAFVVVGKQSSWMAITITAIGAPILVCTLLGLCYFVFRQHFGFFGNDSQRRIKRASGSKSFSWSYSAHISEFEEYDTEHERIYAL